jgi:hypothetical protein
MNLFIAQFHFRRTIGFITVSILPWLGLMFIALVLVTWVEPITLWLPSLFGRTAAVGTAEPGTGDAEGTSNPLLDAFDATGTPGTAVPTTGAPATGGVDDDTGEILPSGSTAAPGSGAPATGAIDDDTGEILPTGAPPVPGAAVAAPPGTPVPATAAPDDDTGEIAPTPK